MAGAAYVQHAPSLSAIARLCVHAGSFLFGYDTVGKLARVALLPLVVLGAWRGRRAWPALAAAAVVLAIPLWQLASDITEGNRWLLAPWCALAIFLTLAAFELSRWRRRQASPRCASWRSRSSPATAKAPGSSRAIAPTSTRAKRPPRTGS
jgi:hypothetical protein